MVSELLLSVEQRGCFIHFFFFVRHLNIKFRGYKEKVELSLENEP